MTPQLDKLIASKPDRNFLFQQHIYHFSISYRYIAMEIISSITDSIADLATSTSMVSEPSLMVSTSYDQPHYNILSRIVWYLSSTVFNILRSILLYATNLIYRTLSYSFEVTLSFSTLLVITMAISATSYSYIRYKYLTVYSRLPEEPKRQEPSIDTFLENSRDETAGQPSYFLYEFLSAIKIFGYLETPVFNELTKSMQTQKLDSGEMIYLDENSGFTICVEGEIEVYCKTGANSSDQSVFSNDNSKDAVIVDGIKYQLLNKIKRGAPLSSMISILYLLTSSDQTDTPLHKTLSPSNLPFPPDNFRLDNNSHHHFPDSPLGDTPSSPHKDSININSETSKRPPSLIAIPKGNCAISIIPREAFHRVTRKYPKTSSHIIQMIMTKLYKVTFQTSHDYLGITPDIMKTEITLNEKAGYELPSYLQDAAIQSFSDKKVPTISGDQTPSMYSLNTDSLKGIPRPRESRRRGASAHGSSITRSSSTTTNRSLSSSFRTKRNKAQSAAINPIRFIDSFNSDADDSLSNLSDDMVNIPKTKSKPFKEMNGSSNGSQAFSTPILQPAHPKSSRHFVLSARSSSNPGDLLSNVPLSRRDKSLMTNDRAEIMDRTFSAGDEETEDSSLRTALSENICLFLGINRDSIALPASSRLSLSSSVVNSPRITGLTVVNNISKATGGINNVTINSRKVKGAPSSKIRTFSTSSLFSLEDEYLNEDTFRSGSSANLTDFESIKADIAHELKISSYTKSDKLINANEETPGIYYVIDGSLDVTYLKNSTLDDDTINSSELSKENPEEQEEEFIYQVRTGGVAGYLGTLVGSKSFVNVTVSSDEAILGFLPREFFEILVDRHPYIQLATSKNLLGVLDRKLFLADYSMEWVHSSAGHSLYTQGDPSNGIYIVLNGRFRSLYHPPNKRPNNESVSVSTANKTATILGEHGQGESLGEVEVLTKTKRLSTVVAIRDSECARIPRTLFEMIALSNPSIMVKVTRIVAKRISSTMNDDYINYRNPTVAPMIKDEPLIGSATNYRTITILPITHGLPVYDFGERISIAFENVGKSVKVLNQTSTLTRLGKHAFDKLAKLKQSGYFSELEDKYDIVIYLADTPVNSNWTKTCIQQGDCVLLLADADSCPDIGEYERLLVKSRNAARTELILLHSEKYVEPGSTNRWLKNRIWVHSHHHIQMLIPKNSVTRHDASDFIPMNRLQPVLANKIISQTTAKIKTRMESIVNNNEFIQVLKQTKESFLPKKYYHPMQEHKDDFMRLARILTGQAIGLVLGGGGARGISHIGVIRALEANDIAVDLIGGTSMGAFVGAIYAREYDMVPVYGRGKKFAGRMSSMWRSLLDLTIPVTSYITGHEFNRGIWKALGDSRIEDFWIKYYANSTNITESVMEIHTSGYAWRYVRASMSLATLLPPLPDNGNMLLDGGYIDNLTVQEMKRRGAHAIIAVDVGSADDRTPMDYGDSLSGMWVLLNKINPFSKHPNVPSMTDIQMRLAYVASVNALEQAKNSEGCIYLRPPIEGYATLDFAKFDEIYQVGSNYANAVFKRMKEKGELNLFKSRRKEIYRGNALRRRNSI